MFATRTAQLLEYLEAKSGPTRTISLDPVLAASISGVAPLSADFSLTYSVMLTFVEATRLRRSRTP